MALLVFRRTIFFGMDVAEPTAEADWGRRPGIPSFNVFVAGSGSIA